MSMDGSGAEKKKASAFFSSSKFGLLEFIAIGALSVLISFLHITVLRGTNMCLLFDGFGFLTTTASCMTIFNFDLVQQVLTYCFSGFNETARLALMERMSSASGIVRCGPLMPTLIGFAYFLSGKPPVPQFWQVGTWAMFLTQALTIALIWLSARLAWNVKVARIAAFLALTYSGFIVNASRLSTETQACFAIVGTTALFLYYAKNGFKHTNGWLSGSLCGLVLGFLALARPPFLLLPVLLVVSLAVAAKLLAVKFPFSRRWLVGTVCGAVLFLAPWALCNKILTGKASITIDRFAVYNLYTGLNTKVLGFDVLPSEYVEHPERFKIPLPDALSQLEVELAADPPRALLMLFLKPVRLLDSPWNDYQLSCYFVPWLLQRFVHQLILVFAFAGMILCIQEAARERTLSGWTRAITLNLVAGYNLIHCLFISMARYTYPVMPVFIVLSAYGVYKLWTGSKRRWIVFACALLAPLCTLLIECLNYPQCAGVAMLMNLCGPSLTAAILALATCAGIPVFAHVVSRQYDLNELTGVAIKYGARLIAFFIFIAAFYGIKQTAFPQQCSVDKPCVVNIPLASMNNKDSSWLLVFDPIFEGESCDVLRDGSFSINSVELKGDLIPLMGVDSSQRDSFVYQKAFAHSGAKDLTDLRQWFCLAVPRELLRENQVNRIEIGRKSSAATKMYVMNDFIEWEKELAPPDPRKFSWTKGFTINPPLDMRTIVYPEWEKVEGGRNIRPRVFLGEVRAASSTEPYLQTIGESDVVDLGSPEISKQAEKRVITLNVDSSMIPKTISGIKSGAGNAIKFKLTGDLTCRDGEGDVSFALITNTGSKETMAPLAPEVIKAGNTARRFEFIDVIPISDRTNFNCSARVLMAGRPWWDVLQYGTFKVDRPVQASNLKLEASVTNLPDLNRQRWNIHKER